MASPCLLVKILALVSLFNACFGSRTITNPPAAAAASARDLEGQQLLRYHKGSLLRGKISVNLIWYGKFTPSQRAIVADFITSLSAPPASKSPRPQPSVASWWSTVEKYYHLAGLSLSLGQQILDGSYSLGKSLSEKQIVKLASKGGHAYAVNVVLTASDVTVDGFCLSRCGTHGSRSVPPAMGKKKSNNNVSKWAYIWVGNSEDQCPGFCAWPFHQPVYGPQSPPLVSPNNDVGMDGVVMSLSGLLAGTATNPFGNGYYQGPAEAPLEAATACPGVYGKGAYPGYAGNLLVDPTTGASYNAHGADGRKYLLPAIYDPTTSKCATLV